MPKPDRPPPELPPWYAIARTEIGVRELPGGADNPRIIEWLKCTNLGPKHWHDSTAHCAAFACWCLQQAGLPNPKYAQARNFMRYGSGLAEPRLGCLVVLWRKSPHSGLGHIGMYVSTTAERLVLFGANQRNQVCEALYPKSHVLGYRWPPGAPLT